ncbi:MAG TPA: RNA ligase family protein [Gemmatimonadales bacterium]|nr:RNA ligase family protein [Gemmatimonadales bacterium]
MSEEFVETERRIHSYPSIYAIGHRAIADLFHDPVVVEEKVDGSQFSFGVIGGELCCRSKGKQLNLDAPEKMFTQAVATAQRLAPLLREGWTYRGEYLQSPKHNTLAYARIPVDHIILYDINPALESYLDPIAKRDEAVRIGLELVPCFAAGTIASFEELIALTERESVLGGATMEGIVVKNYHRFTSEKKAMMGKYVRPAFKEAHSLEWKASNPAAKDVVVRVIETFKTTARWEKALQHLRDNGTLVEGPQDIGPLLKEVPADILKECEADIKAKLFEWAWPQIQRGVTAGLPQWYKDRLAQQAFGSTGSPAGEATDHTSVQTSPPDMPATEEVA